MKRELDYDAIDPDRYRRNYTTVPRERYADTHWRPRIEAAIARNLRGRLLDLGCGFGKYLPALRRAGAPVGVDLSLHWLGRARVEVGGMLVRADAGKLPFGDQVFDGALSVGLLEYVTPGDAIRELARVLRPSARAVVVAPNRRSLFRGTLRAIHRLRHRRYPCAEPTHAQLAAAFAEHGFRILQTTLDDGLVWLPDPLDRQLGAHLYSVVESLFRPLGRNPWSNLMLFEVERG